MINHSTIRSIQLLEERLKALHGIERVAIHWPRLGPIHISKLAVASAALRIYDIDLIAIETASDSSDYAWERVESEEGYRRETLFPERLYEDLSSQDIHQRMQEKLQSLDPDAVFINSYSTPDALSALLWCNKNNRIAVCMTDSREADAARVTWREYIKETLVSQFDAALVSGSESSRYMQLLGIPDSVITLGCDVVDNTYFHEASQNERAAGSTQLPGLDDDRPFFLASARMMNRKDPLILIRAYAAYRNRMVEEGGTPWRLVVLGDGELRSAVKNEIALLSCEADITLAGWMHLDDLPAYYGRASVFVHTALVDQWAVVVNEAMATGLPVIVSDGTGCAEDLVVHGENGFVYPAGDVAALAGFMFDLSKRADLESFGIKSLDIIAKWPLARFADGIIECLENANSPAPKHCRRPTGWLIHALTRIGSSPRSLHTIES